ncbi:rhomboid family intramembrane serine protease [Flexithrix dorotheae]|uniref:rhomboid family intramembrane serine protease n=1 Tax=Flexithrix dorotheae TaxID=70993 RepID=UPI0003731727|nr:rhomboid family intramembrane serine protease [Flexithrix dorotheae]
MSLTESIKIPVMVVAAFWVVEISEDLLGFSMSNLGIYPRTFEGLIGIIFCPFLHGGYSHLISNSATFIILGASILYFYPKISKKVILNIYLLTGAGVWLFARPAYHIGASGLIYGFAGFLFFSGIFRKEIKSMAISLLIALVYGSMLYGIFPHHPGVSWESHMIGALVGVYCAYIFRNYKKESPEPEINQFHGYDYLEGYANMETKRFKYVYKEKEV